MNKPLFCDTCSDGPFQNSNGLRGHRQFSHGVPPKPEGDRAQNARSLESRLSNKIALLENVVAQMLAPLMDRCVVYCPRFCEKLLEKFEEGNNGGLRCPDCHYTLIVY